MDNIFFNEMQPNIMGRPGEIYNRDCEYKQALKHETELFEQLEKDFSKKPDINGKSLSKCYLCYMGYM